MQRLWVYTLDKKVTYQRKCSTLWRLTWKRTICAVRGRDRGRRGKSSRHSQKPRRSTLVERQARYSWTSSCWHAERKSFRHVGRKETSLSSSRVNSRQESHRSERSISCDPAVESLCVKSKNLRGSFPVQRRNQMLLRMSSISLLFWVVHVCAHSHLIALAFHCVFVCGWWVCVCVSKACFPAEGRVHKLLCLSRVSRGSSHPGAEGKKQEGWIYGSGWSAITS